MHGTSYRRFAAAVVIAATALAATGATAAAATHPSRRVEFSPRLLASLAPNAGLLHRMAALLPGTAAPSLASISLFADPVDVTVSGVSYQMDVSAETAPVAFDQPPQLDVELDRVTTGGGIITGEQDHLYGYAPLTGVHLTANAGLTEATLRTGSTIGPTAIDLRFHAAGSVEQTPCTLLGGGRGTFQVASGTLSAATFKVATATTPFFGDITTAPTTATVVHDPGCTSFAGDAAPIFRPQCAGATIQHAGLTSFWVDQRGFGGGRLTQIGVTQSNPFGPDGIDHAALGVGPGTDIGRRVRVAGGGIRVAVRTGGTMFMSGGAVFRSTGAAHVSPGHSCTWERHTYHYTNTRYQGTLTAAGSPLRVLFDTGAETVTPAAATLTVPAYAR
ncbi:MAG TPA: hypothetical protein VGL44_12540 [Gaiellales bacterium]